LDELFPRLKPVRGYNVEYAGAISISKAVLLFFEDFEAALFKGSSWDDVHLLGTRVDTPLFLNVKLEFIGKRWAGIQVEFGLPRVIESVLSIIELSDAVISHFGGHGLPLRGHRLLDGHVVRLLIFICLELFLTFRAVSFPGVHTDLGGDLTLKAFVVDRHLLYWIPL